MTQYVNQGGLQVAKELHTFINQEVLPELEMEPTVY